MRPLAVIAATFGLALSSCFSPGDGQAPPLDRLYFPTGLALDSSAQNERGEPRFLYVASSDFDLQFRSSSLISYDLDRIRSVVPRSCSTDADCDSGACDDDPTRGNGQVPSYLCLTAGDDRPCGAFPEHSGADKLLYPGRCGSIDPAAPQDRSPSLFVDMVGIGAFATDIVIRNNPTLTAAAQVKDATSYPGRLFVPVRGDATLHWIDLNDGKFVCGQSDTDDGSCNAQHRAGNSVFDNTNQLRLPAEPFGVDATADGQYIAVTNQTTGSVSLFSNDWSPNGGPRLESILGGLPSAPVALAALPTPVPANETASPGFLVAYRNAAQVDLLRVRSDLADTPDSAISAYPRYVLTRAGSTAISANSLGFDSRGLAIDNSERSQDYAACRQAQGCANLAHADRPACDTACAQSAPQPSVYIANRAPSSLLVGGLTPDFSYLAGSSELPAFIDSVALTSGPSRVALGNVKVPATASNAVGDDGKNGGPYRFERRVFVVCFDSRRIFVYDPKRRVVEAIVETGRGPFALAIDGQRGLGYVAHFTDSYLGVISLDQRFPQTYASVVASIGVPSPPRASK